MEDFEATREPDKIVGRRKLTSEELYSAERIRFIDIDDERQEEFLFSEDPEANYCQWWQMYSGTWGKQEPDCWGSYYDWIALKNHINNWGYSLSKEVWFFEEPRYQIGEQLEMDF